MVSFEVRYQVNRINYEGSSGDELGREGDGIENSLGTGTAKENTGVR